MASGAAIDARLGAWQPGRPTLLERAAGGDEEATSAAEELVRGIRIALHLLLVAGGCDRIAVGGGLTGLGEPLLERLRASIAEADRASRFHAALGLWERTAFVRSTVPLAALGAAALPGYGEVPGVDLTRSHLQHR